MNFFSIRDIENLTGIKAHTLRIWEQRHHLFTPKRKESRHRIYDNDDLKYILRIAYLYNRGYKISRIAGLSEEEVSRLALELKPGADNYDIFINQLTEAALDFDTIRFEQVLNNLIQYTGFEQSILQVCFPLLSKIGLLWLAGKAMPAQEHFASALVIKKLLLAIEELDPPLPSPMARRRVLLFTPAGELHEIPILFMQYMLKKKGVPYLYVGSNTDALILKTICRQQDELTAGNRITQLYFYLVTNLLRTDLGSYLQQLSDLFPDKEIVFAGAKTNSHIARIPRNVRLLKNAEELEKFCSE
jgi:DNA-binding transcriptional MerR regulator